MLGATNPLNSAPGTIRGDFSIDMVRSSNSFLLLGADVVTAIYRVATSATGAQLLASARFRSSR